MKKGEKDLKYNILLLGLGNPLMGDDGLGVHVCEMLKEVNLLGVKVIDAGTSAIYYLEEISRAESLIIVDAVQAGYQPGTLYSLDASDLNPTLSNWRNAHGCSMLEIVQLARHITAKPDKVIIFGIEPCCLEFGAGLSEPVKNELPKLMEMLIIKLSTMQT